MVSLPLLLLLLTALKTAVPLVDTAGCHDLWDFERDNDVPGCASCCSEGNTRACTYPVYWCPLLAKSDRVRGTRLCAKTCAAYLVLDEVTITTTTTTTTITTTTTTTTVTTTPAPISLSAIAKSTTPTTTTPTTTSTPTTTISITTTTAAPAGVDQQPETSGDYTHIIGGVAGAVVVLIVISIVSIVCVIKQKSKSEFVLESKETVDQLVVLKIESSESSESPIPERIPLHLKEVGDQDFDAIAAAVEEDHLNGNRGFEALTTSLDLQLMDKVYSAQNPSGFPGPEKDSAFCSLEALIELHNSYMCKTHLFSYMCKTHLFPADNPNHANAAATSPDTTSPDDTGSVLTVPCGDDMSTSAAAGAADFTNPPVRIILRATVPCTTGETMEVLHLTRIFDVVKPDLPDGTKFTVSVVDPAQANVLPIGRRSLATSNFKRYYATAKTPEYQDELMGPLRRLLLTCATRLRIQSPDKEVHAIFTMLQAELVHHKAEFVSKVDAVAEFLWTSAKPGILYMAFCSLLNMVIRQDQDAEMKHAVVVIRAINNRRVTRDHAEKVLANQFPPGGLLYRGTSFRDVHQAFFDTHTGGHQFRVPGFLATSSDRSVAELFIKRADRSHPRVLWIIQLDPAGEKDSTRRVKHMAFVINTLVRGEGEYLFSPYSTFSVTSTKWIKDQDQAYEIVLEPSLDNALQPEDLPLSPWY